MGGIIAGYSYTLGGMVIHGKTDNKPCHPSPAGRGSSRMVLRVRPAPLFQ
jgi:hypothetical protein